MKEMKLAKNSKHNVARTLPTRSCLEKSEKLCSISISDNVNVSKRVKSKLGTNSPSNEKKNIK